MRNVALHTIGVLRFASVLMALSKVQIPNHHQGRNRKLGEAGGQGGWKEDGGDVETTQCITSRAVIRRLYFAFSDLLLFFFQRVLPWPILLSYFPVPIQTHLPSFCFYHLFPSLPYFLSPFTFHHSPVLRPFSHSSVSHSSSHSLLFFFPFISLSSLYPLRTVSYPYSFRTHVALPFLVLFFPYPAHALHVSLPFPPFSIPSNSHRWDAFGIERREGGV